MSLQAQYDVIVIGGGPAGMMAATQAAKKGARVLLLEKNASLGKKLLITGGGRCNVTNAEPDLRKLLANYKQAEQFLYSAFSQFSNLDTVKFFNDRDCATKVEDNNRVFPASNKAESIHEVLLTELKKYGVVVRCDAELKSLAVSDGKIYHLTLKNDEQLSASSYILATGGKSRPETGSTGDGFRVLQEVGHTIIEPDPSLVPLAVSDTWVTTLAGVTLPDVKINVYQYEKRQLAKRGRVLFTHVGLSGPTILNMSKAIGEMLPYGPTTVYLDLFPDTDHGTLDNQFVEGFHTHSNKQLKNFMTEYFPASLSEVIIDLSHIPKETPLHSVTREERRKLIHLLKAVPLSVSHLLGTDKAIVTSGGVLLTEVDFKTMCSRKISNLYIVGDLLNIDRPSGGFSLQLCWTTGFVAGQAASLTLTK